MPREVEPSLNEKQFILKALDEGLRLDGRAFDQYRDIELTFGDEYGVADVRLGKTRSAPSPLPPSPLPLHPPPRTNLIPPQSPHHHLR